MNDAGPEYQWDWSQLDPVSRRKRWASLVEWVGWLLENYDPWVKLPECWPRHEPLRSELAFFQEWHREVIETGTPYDGVSWHSSLRIAAEAWSQLATCKHEDRAWRRNKSTTSEAFQRHLTEAMQGSGGDQPEPELPSARPRARAPLPPERPVPHPDRR